MGLLLVLYVLDVLINFELIFTFLNCAFEKIVTRISIGHFVFFYLCEALGLSVKICRWLAQCNEGSGVTSAL